MTLTGCGNDENRKKKDHDSYDDLVYRDGIAYKKFSDVPFSGKVTGPFNGSIKNGKREGVWVCYYGDGQLHYKLLVLVH